ncbi:MAG: hypothetical protein HKN25_09605, partial [Pyrinomonadaceae bacterium]|nr:hypothetical protein [Pyrinomonadaceae bacterium]
PQGLSDKDIPLQAKIVSVADTFDAMTIDRPYQKGMELPAAIERIKSFVGTRYDIRVVNALIQACADGQIGVGRVKLNNFEPAAKAKTKRKAAKPPKPAAVSEAKKASQPQTKPPEPPPVANAKPADSPKARKIKRVDPDKLESDQFELDVHDEKMLEAWGEDVANVRKKVF